MASCAHIWGSPFLGLAVSVDFQPLPADRLNGTAQQTGFRNLSAKAYVATVTGQSNDLECSGASAWSVAIQANPALGIRTPAFESGPDQQLRVAQPNAQLGTVDYGAECSTIDAAFNGSIGTIQATVPIAP